MESASTATPRESAAAGCGTDSGRGAGESAEALLPQLYKELRALARLRMAEERVDHTLQPTALVHEAYVRLVGDGRVARSGWAGRAHFLHAAAEAMRRILIEHARARSTLKRGGRSTGPRDACEPEADEAVSRPTARRPPARRVAFNVLELISDDTRDPAEIVALDDAVSRLEQQDPHLGAVVRLRFYAGMSVEETAAALGISPRSVKRDWAFARAWLFRGLDGIRPS